MVQFRREHPGIAVSLREGVALSLGAMLEQGDLDFAIMASPRGFAERFHVKPLYSERFVVAFAPGHRFARMTSVGTLDCSGESYLMRMNCEYATHWDDYLEKHDIELREVYRSEREDWIQGMVMAGAGICFLPEFSAVIPGLCTRPLIEPEVCREIGLVSVPGRRFSPAMGAFIKTVTRHRWQEREAQPSPSPATPS
jgi:DNA-binding transcriptional LysR family regulator